MQLDKTRIAIRERSLLEILDLSLQVVRFHARPLLGAWLCGVVPFLVLNGWLIGWMADLPDDFGFDKYSYWGRYFWVLIQLVFIEAPLATVPLTLYLGDAMFLQDTGPRVIASTAWRLLPRLFVCLGLVRGLVVAWALGWEHWALLRVHPARGVPRHPGDVRVRAAGAAALLGGSDPAGA